MVGRRINKIKYLPGKTRKLKHFIAPMLARETNEAFDDKEWFFEIKWDGYRAIAEVNENNVLLYSRNGNTFNNSYPIITEALSRLNINAVLDGEIVVLNKQGVSSFQLLQNYDGKSPLMYYVFDVLYVNGKNICHKTLKERKAILRRLLKNNPSVKYSDHIEEKGIKFFEAAGKKKLEGIMAKKADSLYYPGTRTNYWLKIKHHKTIEAIITGFTKPGGARKYFGALVLGIKKGNKLKYAGHTGSGFNEKMLRQVYEEMKPLIQKKSPFDEEIKTNMPVTWIKPELVCEVKYAEITNDGRMRIPIFLRMREEKKATEVTTEQIARVKPTRHKNKSK